MKELTIVMPMAGQGTRFSKNGYSFPKPLIPVQNQPMFVRALSSLRQVCDKYALATDLVFAVLQEHIENHQIDAVIRQNFPKGKVFSLAQTTRGSVETAFLASQEVKPESGLLLLDCDLWFQSSEFESLIEAAFSGDLTEADGALLTFGSTDPRYSYVESVHGMAKRTAEKLVISSQAIAGAYFFRRALEFQTLAHAFLSRSLAPGEGGEYYISNIYNDLIKAGKKIRVLGTDKYTSFGTPGELEESVRYL